LPVGTALALASLCSLFDYAIEIVFSLSAHGASAAISEYEVAISF